MSCNEIYDLLSDDDVSYDYIMRKFCRYDRNKAAREINDEKILIKIALNDLYDYAVQTAVRKISNQEVLKEVLLKNKKNYVREAALLNCNKFSERY